MGKTRMTPLEEAKELQRRVRAAQFEMGGPLASRQFNESEARFRIDAIVGMLIMASNDIAALVKFWEDVA